MTHMASSPPDAPPDNTGWHHAIRWLAGVVLVIGVFMVMQALPLQHIMDRITEWIDGLGYMGVVMYVLIYAIAAVLLLPGWPFTLAAGVIFGFVEGTLIAVFASTFGAALAMFVARYLARDKVVRLARQYPRFAAMDRAVQRGGWRIVALLRLSPGMPYNLQNYFYGLTSINFWTCVLTSAVAMTPGTAMFVYVGFLGFESLRLAAEADAAARLWGFALLVLGLLALLALSVYLTRLARRALREHSQELDTDTASLADPDETTPGPDAPRPLRPSQTLLTAILIVAAVLALTVGVTAQVNRTLLTRTITGLFGTPQVTMVETWAELEGTAHFDHTRFDRLLNRIVTDNGMVDYDRLNDDPADLDAYIAQLAEAPWDALGRDERLALLLNAHNAFMLRLILDHWPVTTIGDIPDARAEAIWQIGETMTVSLNEIEHDLIRQHTIEPRIHWATTYATIDCPPLRNEAYVPGRLEDQLDEQARAVHVDGSRWFRFDREAGVVQLTRRYHWYRDDFEQVADSVVRYAAQYHEPLQAAIDAREHVRVEYLDYDWALNNVRQ